MGACHGAWVDVLSLHDSELDIGDLCQWESYERGILEKEIQ